jgi:RND superfamily putative drug exporter
MGLWLVAAIAIVVLQGAAGGHFDDSFRVPGVESQRAADILKDRFPGRAGQTARIVVHVQDGRLDDADHKPIIDRARQ